MSVASWPRRAATRNSRSAPPSGSGSFAAVTAVIALIVGLALRRAPSSGRTKAPQRIEIAKAIQEGAMAYLRRQFRTIVLSCSRSPPWSPHIDGCLRTRGGGGVDLRSIGDIPDAGIHRRVLPLLLTGFIGMSLAVRERPNRSSGRPGRPAALRIAFRTGAWPGCSPSTGLLGATLIIMIFQNTSSAILIGFGWGSLIAFLRVGGGIFTKAADVGAADLVGKVSRGSRRTTRGNPATIADTSATTSGTAPAWPPT